MYKRNTSNIDRGTITIDFPISTQLRTLARMNPMKIDERIIETR